MSKLMDEVIRMAKKVNSELASANKTKNDTLKSTCKEFLDFFIKFDSKFSPVLDAALGDTTPSVKEMFTCDNSCIAFTYDDIKIIYGKYSRGYDDSKGHFLEVRDHNDKGVRIMSNVNSSLSPYDVDQSDKGGRYPDMHIYASELKYGNVEFTKIMEPVFPLVTKLLTKPRWKTFEALVSNEILKILAIKTADADEKNKKYSK